MSTDEALAVEGTPPPLVTVASVDAVMDAIDALDLEAPWEDVAPRLRLAMPRRRPLPADISPLPERTIGPGLVATLGLDIGPAMLFVTEEHLRSWGVTADAAFDVAIGAVRVAVAARDGFELIEEDIAGTPTIAFQSREGWASALLATPDLLPVVLGRREGFVLAPMRDLVLWLPPYAEPEVADWIMEAIAEEDMNALDIPVLALTDGRLSRAGSTTAAGGTWRRLH